MEPRRTLFHCEDGRPRKSLAMKPGQRGSRWELRRNGPAPKTKDKLLGEIEPSYTQFKFLPNVRDLAGFPGNNHTGVCRPTNLPEFLGPWIVCHPGSITPPSPWHSHVGALFLSLAESSSSMTPRSGIYRWS
jgi:hypothetical protein